MEGTEEEEKKVYHVWINQLMCGHCLDYKELNNVIPANLV